MPLTRCGYRLSLEPKNVTMIRCWMLLGIRPHSEAVALKIVASTVCHDDKMVTSEISERIPACFVVDLDIGNTPQHL